MNDVAPAPLELCAVCRQKFSRSQVVQIAEVLVCSECKPQALQRVQEGLPAGGDVWSQGFEIIAISGAVFPRRCVMCNRTDDLVQLQRKYQFSVDWRLRIPFVHLSVCRRHRRIRSGWLLGGC